MPLDLRPESTSPPPAKPRHVDLYFDEWIAGQVGLSNPERGLYLTACLFIYSHGGSVSESDLRAACRDHGTAYKTQLATLLRLGKLTLNEGQITNKRCSNEIERAEKRVGNAQQNGQKGGRPTNKNNEIGKPAGSGDEKLTTNYQLPTTNLEKVSKTAGSEAEPHPAQPQPAKTAQAPLYAFVGKVIRLTGKDLTQWQTTYHGIPDIIAKLRTLDAYYAENLTGTDQKKWFIRCASALDKAHQEALREARGVSQPPPRHDAGDLSDEQLRELRAKREKANQASAARLAAEIAQSQAIWERDHHHTERGAQ